jgi:Dolichyl-phosphate-mannose-protein mannosyltransferase
VGLYIGYSITIGRAAGDSPAQLGNRINRQDLRQNNFTGMDTDIKETGDDYPQSPNLMSRWWQAGGRGESLPVFLWRWWRRNWGVVLTLVFIVTGALVVRLLGNTYALPTMSYDESDILSRVWVMAQTGDINPHWFRFPSLQLYIDLAILKIMSLNGDVSMESFIVACRVFQAVAGAATTLLVYCIGRRVYGSLTGLVAAFLLAVFPAHILYSHVATGDVFFTFLVMIVLLLSLDLLRHMKRRYYVAAGIVSGLAIATNYHGIFVILAPAAAHFFYLNTYNSEDIPVLARNLFIMAGAAAGAFLIAAPFSLLDFGTFWADTASLTLSAKMNFAEAFASYGQVVDNDIGGVLFLLLIGGVIYGVARHTRYDMISIAFCVLCTLFLMGWNEANVRFTLPLVIYALVMASALVVAVPGRILSIRNPGRRRLSAVMIIIVLAWSLMVPTRVTSEQLQALQGSSVSEVILEWVGENIPEGSYIYQEPDTAGACFLCDAQGRALYSVDRGDKLSYEYPDYNAFHALAYEYVIVSGFNRSPVPDAKLFPTEYDYYRRLYVDYEIVSVNNYGDDSYGAPVIDRIHDANSILILQRR